MLITFSGCSCIGKTEIAFAVEQHLNKNRKLETVLFLEHEYQLAIHGEYPHNISINEKTKWDQNETILMCFQLAYRYQHKIKPILQNQPNVCVVVDTSVYQYLYEFMHNQEINEILTVCKFLNIPFDNDAHHKHFYLDAPLMHLWKRRMHRDNITIDYDHEIRKIKSYKKLCALGYLIEIDASGSIHEVCENVCRYLAP